MTRALQVREVRRLECADDGGVSGYAAFSDGAVYEFHAGRDGREIGFCTAPAFGTGRTRWFDSPQRADALKVWLHEQGVRKRPLHLLLRRGPFAEAAYEDDEKFARTLAAIRNRYDGECFGFPTRIAPSREAELAGGSVYVVHKREARFRMPFVRVAPHFVDGSGEPEAPPSRDGPTSVIQCKPEMVPVERRDVGRLAGWRYLEDAVAPADSR